MNKTFLKNLISTIILFSSFVANSQEISVPSAPNIAAKSYVLMDFNSERILAEKDVNKQVDPASITKMMTAYVVFKELKQGRLSKQDEVTISEKAWRTGGSKMFIEVNKRVKVSDLIKGMVIQSGNDACIALAEHIAGSEESFADLMNQHAKKLNMTGSFFENATGLPSDNHKITAIDAAKLAKAIISEFPEEYKVFAEKEFTYNNIKQHNRNTLLWRDSSVDGFKTGHTEAAGYCLVSSANKNGMRLISVVMGTDSQKTRAAESQKLLNYGFRFYETNLLYKANEKRVSAEVWKGQQEFVDLGLAKDLYITIPRGKYKSLKANVDLPNYITAPIQKSQTVATLEIDLEGELIAKKPLVALQNIEQGGWWTRATDNVGLWFKSFGDDDE